MPTDIKVAIEKRRLAQSREAADLIAIVLLIPLTICLGLTLLALGSPAFTVAIASAGME